MSPTYDRTHTATQPRVWEYNGDETMSPFWGVRRLTEATLHVEVGNWNAKMEDRNASKLHVIKHKPEINCKLVSVPLSTSTSAMLQMRTEHGFSANGQHVQGQYYAYVDAITNESFIDEGAELILGVRSDASQC